MHHHSLSTYFLLTGLSGLVVSFSISLLKDYTPTLTSFDLNKSLIFSHMPYVFLVPNLLNDQYLVVQTVSIKSVCTVNNRVVFEIHFF